MPNLEKIDVKDKRVLLRLDLDVDIENDRVADDYRLRTSIPTFKYLIENQCSKITVLGHRGRPVGFDQSLSLRPVEKALFEILKEGVISEALEITEIIVKENLRFDPREEENDKEYAQELAKEGDVYINDAFGVSHRENTSVVALPVYMKSKSKDVAAGFRLVEETGTLGRILETPKRPVVFVFGGGKMDKVLFIDKILDHADWVLAGGVLPQKIESYCREKDGRMCVVAALLTSNAEDITPDSARNFAEVISGAGTIVWNGPMGDIDKDYWDGTEVVANAISQNGAFKVVGGGDTIRALKHLGLLEKMDYVSTGGGAMIEFLTYGDLTGLKALR